jgi:ATP-binding cassette, subfamily B, bacterial
MSYYHMSSYTKLTIKYFKPHILELLGVLIASGVTASSLLLLGQGIKYLIDNGLTQGDYSLLNKSLFLLLLTVALLSMATFIRSFMINSVAEKVVAALKRDVYKNVINISPSYFELGKTSEITNRITHDTNFLANTIGSVLSYSIRNIFMSVGGIILLFHTSAKLTVYTIIILPFVLLSIIYFGKKVKKISKINQDAAAFLTAHLEETINGIKVVQSSNRQVDEAENFGQKVDASLGYSIEWIKQKSIMVSVAIFIVFFSIVLVLWRGGMDVISGSMSAGALTSFIFYSIMVASSIGILSEIFGDLQKVIAATKRLFQLLEIPSSVIEKANPTQLPLENYPLIVKDVSFYYPSRNKVAAANDLNFTINPGETFALVGPSGAGKSTIFQLLLRFFDPSSGVIKLGEHNISDLSLENLRSFFAYVPQEPLIFSASAYENIAYGKANATLEEVREAAKTAEILEFIDGLPDGMNTFLGEKGISISGGQKQRIVIARAILRNPKILLLDEATSNLDSHNERLVQSAIDKLMMGRTTIIIAHRLSTIVNADKIIVINKGKIEAIGTHAELIAKKDFYYHLLVLDQ